MARRTPTVQEAFDEYMSTREHTALNTQINDRSVLRGFVRHLGDIQMGHATARHVESFFLGPEGVGSRMNGRSFNKVRQRVSGFLTFCEGRGYNRRQLLANVRPRPVVHRERLRLSPSELLTLVEATEDERDRCMLAVAVNLGLRASEIVALRVRDVHLQASALHVTVSKSHTEDVMFLSSDLEPAIRRWLAVYQETSPRPLQPDDFLFPARHAPRLLTMQVQGQNQAPRPRGLRPDVQMTHPAKVVQRALRRNGFEIEAGEGFHTLRRSAARAFFDSMSEAGHDEALRLTMCFLHHSSTQVTEVYLGLRHERVKRDVIMKGRPFLSAMVDHDNVLPLRRSGSEAGSRS
jgi:integrase